MTREDFSVSVAGGRLAGWVAGAGPQVLLLHGGPGLSYDYLDGLAAELLDGYRVAAYQQRGLAPSTAGAPYDVPAHVSDVVAVLDELGWDTGVILGHSWGGHLLLNVVATAPERVRAALVVEPIGCVGDGGVAEFEAEMIRRTPAEDVTRAEELDRRAMAGEGSVEDMAESLRLFWPAYFADPATAPPFPGSRLSVEAYAATLASMNERLPGLADRLAGSRVPTVLLAGAGSPIPVSASVDSAAAIGPAATVVVVDGVGHFPWLERPGEIRSALDRVAAQPG